jgi:hypothetical protein
MKNSNHPWRTTFNQKIKLSAAKKAAQRRYQRDWHREDRSDPIYKQAEIERSNRHAA